MPPKKPEVQAMVDTHQAETAADKVAAELRLVALRDTLQRSKQEFAGLSAVAAQLRTETASSKADLHDINEFLTNQLKATALTNATLASRIDDLEQRLAEAAAAHAEEMARIKREVAAEKAENDALMAVWLDKSSRADSFLEAEHALLERVRTVEQRSADIKLECEERIREVERQAVAFKERMRKEQAAAIKAAEVEARQKAKGENLTLDQLNATLHSQAAQVTQLLEELGKLQTRTSETARSLELVRASEAALLEKGALYRQAIRVLTAKLQDSRQKAAYSKSLRAPTGHTAALLGASLQASTTFCSQLHAKLGHAQRSEPAEGVQTAKLQDSRQKEAWSKSLRAPTGHTAALLGASFKKGSPTRGHARSPEDELADARQEIARLREGAAMGQLALHPDSLPSLAKCVSDIVQDRVAGVLSSPPSSGKPASSARCKLCQYPSDPDRVSSTGLTLFERQRLQEWLQAALRERKQVLEAAAEQAEAELPPGPEGLRLDLAALQAEAAQEPLPQAATGETGPAFRTFSGSSLFKDLLEGPGSGIAA